MLPFVVVLGTRLRWAALGAAAAGIAVAAPLTGLLPFGADGWGQTQGWIRWVIVAYCAGVSLLMAVAEALVAKLMLRGRFWVGLLFAVAAHAAWIWYLFDGFGAGAIPRHPYVTVYVLETAMIGATAATLGAYRG